LISGVLGRAGEKGKRERLEAAKTGEVPFKVKHNLKMPQQYYEALDKDDDARQVIDLRDEETIGKVRFAEDER
jgi:uracil phosphoribosyltransferase